MKPSSVYETPVPARRIAIDRIEPDVDAGRFAVKRIIHRPITIRADIVCDGDDELSCSLHIRPPNTALWTTLPLTSVGNDRWESEFIPDQLGIWEFTVSGRVDYFKTWHRDLVRRNDHGEDLQGEFAEGCRMIERVIRHGSPDGIEELIRFKNALQNPDGYSAACDPELATLMATYTGCTNETRLEQPRRVRVDRERAEFGAWYEAFPRSWGSAGRHGTLTDFTQHLGYIKSMGFDVIYLPPIHPIGHAFRKGKNNSITAGPEDVGSPWGIGSADGGHSDIHPELGTLADFENLRRTAADQKMELALDLALQCSPDHPWVTEHPEWFYHRADGTIRFAENPPKKYQDIYPLNFETTAWRELWDTIRETIEIWITRGVRIFRVDNPHTKPFDFWEWLLSDIQKTHPDVLFLAEAFTRPKIMYRLAKLGFSQSYTYFTWRTEKKELEDYLHEITTPPVSDFFRPNFFTNTPDILHKTLQSGGRAMFIVRLGLAALSTGNWGIYGPAMELQQAVPREPGSEEYLNSEKYEIKQWNIEATDTLAPFIARLNHIRNSEAALRNNTPAVSEAIDEEFLLAWSRYDPSSGNHVLVVVNLEPHKTRTGRITLRANHSSIKAPTSFSVTNLLTGKERVTPFDNFSVTCTQADPVVVLKLTPIFEVTEDSAHA